jgi:hypothetical protein
VTALAIIILAQVASSAPTVLPTQQVLSVAQVRRLIDGRQHIGQIVRVRGYVDRRCYNLGCNLKARRRGNDDSDVSIAGGSVVEQAILLNRGRRVTIRARISEPALYTELGGDLVVSTDRASEIIPLSIEGL